MDFYYFELSSPCRAVLLTAEALGVKMNKKVTNIMAGETRTPEFMALNPQHCLPTLVDGDLKLWESRAICSYLVTKCGKEDTFYPRDAKCRARVDRLLYFDMGTLYQRFGDYVYPVLFGGKAEDSSKLEGIQEALGWFNGFLDGHDFAAGCKITIADHTLVATVASMQESGIDISKHTNVVNWLKRCQTQMPGYECCNGEGARKFGTFAKSKLGL